jgi:hypothetical protein
MRIAEQIGHILGLSERQVHRRLADGETVALKALKAIRVGGDLGQRLDNAMHQLEDALPHVKAIDPKFAQVVDELAYRIKQWQADSAARELEEYEDASEPIKRDDYVYRNWPYEDFQEAVKVRAARRSEALAALRKKLTGSSEPPPAEPEEAEMEPQSAPSPIADTPSAETK